MGSNARLGKSQYLVAEADESDRSFLKLSPILSVVTNIDREHMDCYRDMRDVKRTFLEFMERVPFYGMVVACNDDRAAAALAAARASPRDDLRNQPRLGFPDPHARRPDRLWLAGAHSPLSRFQVTYKEKDLGEFALHVPGAHNVLNATAAIAVGIGARHSGGQIRSALDGFRGVDRRFQSKGKAAGVSVVDDYGHHPTEIRATLAAARQCGFRRVHVIFQPHRYTRTRDLMDEFATAFADADTLCLLDIYAASEKPIEGITAEALAGRIAGAGKRSVAYAPSFADASPRLPRLPTGRHDADARGGQRLATRGNDSGEAGDCSGSKVAVSAGRMPSALGGPSSLRAGS